MSLRVWLPLTKDLRNQGLDDVTVTNNGATFNSKGKLGGCYEFDGTNDFINLGNISSYFTGSTHPFSICFWIYSSESGTRGVIFSSYGLTSTNNFFSLEINSGSVTNNSLRFDWSGSPDWATDIILTLNTWIHIGVIYDGTQVKFYKDGELIQTKSQTLSTLSTGNNWYLGRDSRTGTTAFSGKLNDFRIYDHALSQMEVKQLSQGLVLHYPLNRQGFGQENLLKDSHVSVNTSSYAMHDYYFVTGEEPIEGETYTIQIKGQLGEGKKYFSPYNSGGSISQITLYPSSQKNGIYTGTFSWRKVTASNTFLRVYHMNSSTVVASTIEWVKLEKGEIATPWCPNHTDELYTTMGLDSNIEYDTSGYCNNGTQWAYDTNGEIDYTSDTPKYAVSTYINSDNNTTNTASGTQYIYGNCELTTPQYLTVAFWCKPIAGYGNSTGQGQFSLTNYPIGNDAASDYLAGPMNHRDTIIDVNSSTGTHKTVAISFTANEWHHYVVVYDGRYARVYKDGIAGATADMGSTITLGSMKGAVIGFSKAGGVWRSNKSYYSDFRIYATALSADDVLSLYQNCATIDPDGTIRGQIRS